MKLLHSICVILLWYRIIDQPANSVQFSSIILFNVLLSLILLSFKECVLSNVLKGQMIGLQLRHWSYYEGWSINLRPWKVAVFPLVNLCQILSKLVDLVWILVKIIFMRSSSIVAEKTNPQIRSKVVMGTLYYQLVKWWISKFLSNTRDADRSTMIWKKNHRRLAKKEVVFHKARDALFRSYNGEIEWATNCSLIHHIFPI